MAPSRAPAISSARASASTSTTWSTSSAPPRSCAAWASRASPIGPSPSPCSIGFLLLAGESYLATYTLSRFELSQGIFGPTEIRILLIIGNFALLHSPYATIFGYKWLLFDVGGIIAAVSMFVMTIFITARHTAQLYREEPLP